ncbi:tripartite motif-containing protein 5-like [Perognathus longimembris pacificus]|uniref:tripartite motif-containing protein 5-like n=1 Tax=Perognathus longimembris pacificus TaxID=214514 RepID=UPI002018DC75|nr:tripartite motif-containing protein 5-like [Perognathus longimembris pacificus]XP_048217573.1 tripartite motif-containing protein 5-like [Perognathus longimembris pacificus]
MASAILANVKDEVTCPICLELMREPMSIDCGHSFCQACITTSYKSTIGPGGKSNCPMCQMPYKFESLRLNRHMANIVQSLRGVKLSSQEQNVHQCPQHGEKLQLFCRDDGKVICWLCERSQQHQGHHTCLLEEVVQEYQNKLQAVLEKLKKNKKESEKWKAELQQEKTSWKSQVQSKIQNVQADFTQLRGILDSEEEKVLQKLKKEAEDGLRRLAGCENELTQQSKCVSQLISDVELQLEGSPMEMLQGVNTIMRRSELLTMKKPMTFPKKEQEVFPITGLRGMLQVFQELTDARQYWVHVTANTKDSRIFISQDQRQIKYQSTPVYSQPSLFSHNSYTTLEPLNGLTFGCSASKSVFQNNGLLLGVLGAPVITSGKHYWEVDVSRKTSWHLGVSDGRHFRPRPWPDPTVHEVPRPKVGYWIIGMEKKSEYKVFLEDPTSHLPLPMPLCLPVALDRVGVFVDYQAGSVSFYSTTYNAFLIYKFTNCSFPCQVYPYFSPLQCSEPMTLC